MRPFKLNLALLLVVPVVTLGEDSLHVTVNPQAGGVSNQIESEIETWRGRAVSEGRLNAVLHLESMIQSDSSGVIQVVWANNHGEPVSVDSVILSGKSGYSLALRRRITKPFKNRIASYQTIEDVQLNFLNYSFIELDDRPYYARYLQERIALVIPVRSSEDNRFSGMVGYLPAPGGRGRLTGNIFLSFSNLLGFGASSQIQWVRKDERSQRFSLRESVPIIPGTNLGAGFGIFQSFQKGFYLRRRAEFELTSVSKRLGTVSIGTSETVTSPTEIGRDGGFYHYRSRAVTVGQSFGTKPQTIMNDEVFVDSRLELGDLKRSNGKKVLLVVGHLHGGWVKSISSPWDVAILLRTGRAVVSGHSVPDGEKFRFGGASSLRGYGEEQFRADWMVIHQSELRYELGENVRLYGFIDGAVIAAARQPLALGIGFKQPTSVGMLSVEYAVSRDDRPSQGKIHLRISGRIG
ncbi:MAG: hypothetical protein VX822_02370 [Candidatus Neomarinimicrobiota bacterium]|nr:hypothetical protein [Candidatus Neomarinimicrobiota bacterium]